ncbi:MAG: ImmA/IrrE family metallo-endopeptidase [Deltaproteobacteria bacterium]|nr:ImmA/IrrE family metallo-endopeptidase [Deltaproteobacteria bacterium]MBW2345145.1 ImmA/IrrE family metallo-endopeptidase [Deltaproteobacteria bacterium]
MITRLIKTEEDYTRALDRIEALMDAEAGTTEADELELLSALVEMYEEKEYPIDLPDPVEAVKFRMEQLGLKQKDLIPFIGSRSKVSEVLNGKKSLTLSMMRGLNKGLGIPAEVLLNEPGADFPDGFSDLEWNRFPVVEMAKRGWLAVDDYSSGQNEELMRAFIGRAGGFESVSAAFLRQGFSARMNAKADKYAVSAWCLRVLELAHARPLKKKYEKGMLASSALKEISRLSYFSDGPLLAREYLEKQGIRLIIVSHLPKTYLDGAAMLLSDGSPVVGLTLRYDRLDNFWFSLLHELVHIAKHLSQDRQIILDDFDLRKHDHNGLDRVEQEADERASSSLIPDKYWKQISSIDPISSDVVKETAEKLKIHPAIIAGRIRFERNNYRLLTRLVGQGKLREMFNEYK